MRWKINDSPLTKWDLGVALVLVMTVQVSTAGMILAALLRSLGMALVPTATMILAITLTVLFATKREPSGRTSLRR